MLDKTVQAVANYFKMDDSNWFYKKFDNLTGDEGIKVAQKYLDWASNGQRNAMSDYSYYGYENDQQFAKAMIQVFTFTKTGKYIEEIPLPPILNRDDIPQTEHGTPLWSTKWRNGGICWISCLFEHLNGKEQPRHIKQYVEQAKVKIIEPVEKGEG